MDDHVYMYVLEYAELVKSWEAGERSPEMAQGFSLSMLYGMSLNDMTFNLQAQEA